MALRRLLIVLAGLGVAGLAAGHTWAQEQTEQKPPAAGASEPEAAVKSKPAPREAEAGQPRTNLRVELLIQRAIGDKKLATLPYTFVVATGAGKVQMRMGVETPIPVVGGAGFNYRTVGTNIDCWAKDLGNGRFGLDLKVENSSVFANAVPAADPAPSAAASGAPLFRRFDTSLNPILRDGQTIQTIASTDPVTGEVVKIDVTLHVVK